MNKIIIDGKEYELSAELVEKIKAEVVAQEKKESPFERTEPRLPYWFIDSSGGVDFDTAAAHSQFTDYRFFVGNYCTDKSLMEQRALHETLNRLLWRYSEMHGRDPRWMLGDYPANVYHFEIVFVPEKKEFRVTSAIFAKTGGVYFKDAATAAAAIDEVVVPFLASHPEFEW